MELLVAVIIGLGIWWWAKARRAEAIRKSVKTSIFETPDRSFAVHLPSMTWASWTLGGIGVVFAGPVRREDGPRWSLGQRSDPAASPEWKPADEAIAGPLEIAYQRFVRADINVDIARQPASAWLEQVRGHVHQIQGANVFITGYDRPQVQAAQESSSAG